MAVVSFEEKYGWLFEEEGEDGDSALAGGLLPAAPSSADDTTLQYTFQDTLVLDVPDPVAQTEESEAAAQNEVVQQTEESEAAAQNEVV